MEVEREHRLTAVEDLAKSNKRRIEKLENLTEAIHTMSNTMVRLVEQTQNTNQKVEELKDKVDAIEREPADNLKHLKRTAVTAVITGVLGAIIGALISLVIKGS